jgi:hypothetical protein
MIDCALDSSSRLVDSLTRRIQPQFFMGALQIGARKFPVERASTPMIDRTSLSK